MLDSFRAVVVVDFEFEFGGHASPEAAGKSGERPRPVCMVAKELRGGKEWRLWRGEFGAAPPFSIGPETLVVAYYASAELGCFRALEWPAPARILDLYVEFRDHTNGLQTPAGSGLIGALAAHGLDTIGAEDKDNMRALVLRGGPWSDAERAAVLDYCASDVLALQRLLPAMMPRIDLPRALLRARYMAAAAAMEHNGVPIDAATLASLREHWDGIKDDLISAVDDHGIYDGRTFKHDRFARWLADQKIPWPLHPNGVLDLSRDTFRQQSRIFSAVAPLHELRSTLSELRLNDLAVGADSRNRTILSAFQSRTGRNQPSNSRSIFGPARWIRGLIKPPPGYAIANIDFEQQEFAIAAALSGDTAMIEAYQTGDPYLAFAKQAGAVPQDATKKTHPTERELFKATCGLGALFGMGANGLAMRIARPPIEAAALLRAHHETYRKFWRWSDQVLDHAYLTGSLHTTFGWHIHLDDSPNPRSLRNFLMQANGSEMLRLGCCLGIERGIEICAPIHDAVLICAPLDRIEADVAAMQACMVEASRIVLDGFELRTEAAIVRSPDRYMDERGRVMWDRVTGLIGKMGAGASSSTSTTKGKAAA